MISATSRRARRPGSAARGAGGSARSSASSTASAAAVRRTSAVTRSERQSPSSASKDRSGTVRLAASRILLPQRSPASRQRDALDDGGGLGGLAPHHVGDGAGDGMKRAQIGRRGPARRRGNGLAADGLEQGADGRGDVGRGGGDLGGDLVAPAGEGGERLLDAKARRAAATRRGEGERRRELTPAAERGGQAHGERVQLLRVGPVGRAGGERTLDGGGRQARILLGERAQEPDVASRGGALLLMGPSFAAVPFSQRRDAYTLCARPSRLEAPEGPPPRTLRREQERADVVARRPPRRAPRPRRRWRSRSPSPGPPGASW